MVKINLKEIHLTINGAGCVTDCIHCWANGGRYKNMSFDDIKFVSQSFKDFTEQIGYNLNFNVMHELLAHPDALRILELQYEQNKGNPHYAFFQIPTSGIPVAIREDYKELLDGLVKNKVENLHYVLHGIGEIHDKAVNLKNGFEKLKISIERTKEAGLVCSIAIFLNKSNISQFNDMQKFLLDYEIKMGSYMIARYISGKKLQKYDEMRVEYSDLLPVLNEIKEDKIIDVGFGKRDLFHNPENYTEAAFYRKAVEGEEIITAYDIPKTDIINIICDKDFNIYDGSANVFGKCYGNLKEDSGVIFEKLNGDIINDRMEYIFSPALFYPNETIPPLKEVAEKYGDKKGQKIYAGGIYYKWLDKIFLK